MATNDLSKQLESLKVEDLQIDELGRIVIDNPALADRLREQGKVRPSAFADNVACCENLAKCGAKITAEHLRIRDRLVSARTGRTG